MKIFDRMKNRGHEQLVFCLNKPTGLRAIIAIHDTSLGGIEGMVHISELSERRLLHPREVLNEGDEITVRVMGVDLDRRRISLSRRQAGDYAGD